MLLFGQIPYQQRSHIGCTKKHFQEFTEVDQDSLAEVMYAAQLLSKILEKVLNTDGITVMQNNGIFKGVKHYHMHIIPHFKEDGFSWIEPENNVSKEEFISLTNQLREVIDINPMRR